MSNAKQDFMAKKMKAVQSMLSDNLPKDRTNTHLKYDYSSHNAVVSFVNKHTVPNGLTWSVGAISIDTTQSNPIVEYELTVTDGAWDEKISFFCPVANGKPDGYGIAMSYAKKYLLSLYWGLSADDDDFDARVGQSSSKNPGGSGVTEDQILSRLKVNLIRDLVTAGVIEGGDNAPSNAHAVINKYSPDSSGKVTLDNILQVVFNIAYHSTIEQTRNNQVDNTAANDLSDFDLPPVAQSNTTINDLSEFDLPPVVTQKAPSATKLVNNDPAPPPPGKTINEVSEEIFDQFDTPSGNVDTLDLFDSPPNDKFGGGTFTFG